ncbi:MAG TPA: DUF2299 family protein [Candidatus Nitrosotalea sp.]|nr:DUF2299 family protein [Candidatus Nitrosotalea sp.]
MDYKEKIKMWFALDHIETSEVENTLADFQLVLKNVFGLGFTINIAKPKDNSILQIMMKLASPKVIQNGFASLTMEEKLQHVDELKMELLKLDVDYEISANLESVMIADIVYLEDMTRTTFMDALRSVRNGALVTISFLSRKFNPGYESTPPHTHLDVSSPYG